MYNNMRNPWQDIDFNNTPPYVLESEKRAIHQYNETKEKRSDYYIHLDLIPEPYIGNLESCKILLLCLNPSYDIKDHDYHSKDNYFRTISINNLLHKPSDYPFYLLDPKVKESPGSKWWRRILSNPLEDKNDERGDLRIAHSLAVVEFFPYHSLKYKGIGKIIETQKYSFKLIRKCMKRKISIVLMRSFEIWFDSIPELKEYENLLYCRSDQNPTISPGNLSQYRTNEERKEKKENSNLVYQRLINSLD